jgi:hypothetical protein
MSCQSDPAGPQAKQHTLICTAAHGNDPQQDQLASESFTRVVSFHSLGSASPDFTVFRKDTPTTQCDTHGEFDSDMHCNSPLQHSFTSNSSRAGAWTASQVDDIRLPDGSQGTQYHQSSFGRTASQSSIMDSVRRPQKVHDSPWSLRNHQDSSTGQGNSLDSTWRHFSKPFEGTSASMRTRMDTTARLAESWPKSDPVGAHLSSALKLHLLMRIQAAEGEVPGPYMP